ncbi:MAG: hypothetical protein GXN93_05455 [Candidatus Diapherotrites archaeon]|nr:hypothetical protein [Candidatus Diapherotrites archaeon]
MRALGAYWRLSGKDLQLLEMHKRGASEKEIRRALGLTHRQIRQKLEKLRRLGKI